MMLNSGKRQMLCELLDIRYPIVQAGMVWVSGGKLASASANAGILGVVGAGSMKPELLREHLRKAKALTSKAIAVNVPLLYEGAEEQIQVALDEGVKKFITSAGSPKKFTEKLKSAGCKVIHVVSSPSLAKKCQDAGVDAVIAEGFEAGGHNGRDELTTMVLIPQVVKAITIPVIAAGGIATGGGMLAAFALGASGVQMGTRFVASQESSAHEAFRQAVISSTESSTVLCMKKLTPVRLFKNNFYDRVKDLEDKGSSTESLKELLGKGRAKKGMLEGDLVEGELEIGQVCALVRDIPSVATIVANVIVEYEASLQELMKR